MAGAFPGVAHYPPEADDITFGKVAAFRKEVEKRITVEHGEKKAEVYKQIVADSVASSLQSAIPLSDKTLEVALQKARSGIESEDSSQHASTGKDSVVQEVKQLLGSAQVLKRVSNEEFALFKSEEIVAPLVALAGDGNRVGDDDGEHPSQQQPSKHASPATGSGAVELPPLVEDNETWPSHGGKPVRGLAEEQAGHPGFPEDAGDVKVAMEKGSSATL